MNARSKRTVLVTGAGSGFGKAIVERLAANGDQVIATVRDPRRAEKLTTEAGMRGLDLRYRALELTDAGQVAAIAREVSEAGGVDVLVHNAGAGVFGPVEEVDAEATAWQFAVNVFGPLDLTRRLLPSLRERKGCILFIGSLGGRLAMPFQAHYSATKAALAMFSDALRMELEPFGVRVCCVEPGDFATGFTDARRSQVAATSPYKEQADRALQAVHEQERGGPGPEWVAEVVDELSRMEELPARRPVGRWARTLCLLQRVLPDGLREAGVKGNYRLKA